MPVTRERVDPIRAPDELGLVHRRWILPDDVSRPVPLAQLSRLWRRLLELDVLDGRGEARLERFGAEDQEMPAQAAGGALLAGTGGVSLLTQMVWLEDGRRDPYAEEVPEGYRDYTLYAVDTARYLLLPIPPAARLCAACGQRRPLEASRFGEGALLDREQPCACGAALDLGRDKGELKSGAVFLLEELVCRAALSIELPRAPEAEELPDAEVARSVRETFGGTDELADDNVEPAE